MNAPFSFTLPEGYTLLQYCAHGAYGSTFLVSDLLGRRLVLKIIPRAGDRFLRELNGVRTYCAGRFVHENLISILHSGEEKDYFYYTMPAADNLRDKPDDYLPASLENILHIRRLETDEIFAIALALLNGIVALHKSNIAHRDIKPDNILFFNGKPCLSDVGLVSQARGRNSLVGTYGFLPPELLSGKMTFDSYLPLHDFYALGKVIYCMLTGLPVDNFPLLRPEHIRDNRTRKLSRLLLKICERTPSWRLADADTIRRELERLRRLPEKRAKFTPSVLRAACWCGGAAILIAAAAAGFHCWKPAGPEPERVPKIVPAAPAPPVSVPESPLPEPPLPEPEPRLDDARAAQLEQALRQKDMPMLVRLFDSGVSPNSLIQQHWRPLHYVIRRDAPLELVRLLVERGARLDLPDMHGELPLGTAIASNAPLPLLTYLIEQTPDLDSSVELKKRLAPLSLTLTCRNFPAFQLLLHHGAAPNPLDELGRTPLFKTASHNYQRETALLLKAGADTRSRDNWRTTPLHHLPPNRDIAATLLQHDADPNAQDRDGNTPLLASIRRNAGSAVIQLLLQSGAEVNAADIRGITPLLEAVASGNAELVELLLDNGADPKQADRRGFNALYAAVIYRRFDILLSLLQRVPDSGFRDAAGRTLLHWAVIRNQPETARLLRHFAIDPAAADLNGRSAADWAVLLGRAEVLRELAPQRQNELDASSPPPFLVDPPRGGNAGYLLRMLNSPQANMHAIDAAIRHCPDLDRMPDGGSWLCAALERDHLLLLTSLLSHGADPNALTTDGRTPLAEAVLRNRPEAVKPLLQYGALPDDSELNDLPLLEEALRMGSTHILSLLLPSTGYAEKALQKLAIRCQGTIDTEGLSLLKSVRISTFCCRDDELRSLLVSGNTAGVHRYLSGGTLSADCQLWAGDYPLPCVLARQPQYAMAKALLEAGAQTELSADGTTALHMATAHGELRLVRLLLEYGADPGALDPQSGETALTYARKKSGDPQLEALLEFYAFE